MTITKRPSARYHKRYAKGEVRPKHKWIFNVDGQQTIHLATDVCKHCALVRRLAGPIPMHHEYLIMRPPLPSGLHPHPEWVHKHPPRCIQQ